jgi:hypothetical protein
MPLVEIEKLCGTHFGIIGGFWPETTACDRGKWFNMIVLNLEKDWKPPPLGGHKEIKMTDSTLPMWDYLQRFFPDVYDQVKKLKQHTRERDNTSGESVLLYSKFQT